MRRLSLILSFIIIVTCFCSCSRLRTKITPPIENAGEIVTAPPLTDTAEPGTDGTGDTETGTDTDGGDEEPEERESAITLDGRTIVISVFASDVTTAWTTTEEDTQMKKQMLDTLATACDWITDRAAEYDVKSEFVYDWELHSDLRLHAKFSRYNMLLEDSGLYPLVSRDIKNNVHYDSLKEKYDADDVIFVFFFNTNFENTLRPMSLTTVDSPEYELEYSIVPVRTDGQVTSPSTLAHELLHFFGAHDLYEVEGNPIPKEFIDHLDAIGSNDIMRTVQIGNVIESSFSDLDAYYTGLIDHCDDVVAFNLPKAARFAK